MGASAIIAGLAVTLIGCAAIQVKLGIKVHLNTLQVTSMDASLAKGPALAPGQKLGMVATLTSANGTHYVTEGAGGGKILWSDLTVTATVVNVSKKGVVSLSRDPRISDGKTGQVLITAPSHPELRAELEIPLRYNIAFAARFQGDDGTNGMDGTDGISGTSGMPGSIDPDNPSPGGNGGDGTNGSDGSNGSDGGDGPGVQVWLTMHPGAQTLVEAGVQAQGRKEHYYLIDHQGGTLTVESDGGAGGQGGRGGRGGQGGSGGSGSPDGSNGSSGLDGSDGMSGASGNAGRITVTYDSLVTPHLKILQLPNRTPAPVMTEGKVAPLW